MEEFRTKSPDLCNNRRKATRLESSRQKKLSLRRNILGRVSASDTWPSLPLFFDLIEVRGEPIGVHCGHPLQIGADGLSLRLGNAEVRHRAGPGAVLLRVRQEF